MRTILLGTVLLVGLAGTLLLQRNALSGARAEQAALLAAQAEAEQLRAANEQLAAARARAAGKGTASSELLKLRNEVRELRALAEEVSRLRAANLRQAQQTNVTTRPLSQQEGYVAKEQWAESGSATPEATIQTFFRAARDRDITRLLQCVNPAASLSAGFLIDPKTGQLHPSAEEALRVFGLMKGFRVEQRTEASPEDVTLEIRAATGGATLRLRLLKLGEEWKISGM